MSQPEGGDEHVQLGLGLYVLGALSVHEAAEIEGHLARCASCRDECDQLAEVRAFLALADEDAGAIIDEFGVPSETDRVYLSQPVRHRRPGDNGMHAAVWSSGDRVRHSHPPPAPERREGQLGGCENPRARRASRSARKA
jgi:hypothetical protein